MDRRDFLKGVGGLAAWLFGKKFIPDRPDEIEEIEPEVEYLEGISDHLDHVHAGGFSCFANDIFEYNPTELQRELYNNEDPVSLGPPFHEIWLPKGVFEDGDIVVIHGGPPVLAKVNIDDPHS